MRRVHDRQGVFEQIPAGFSLAKQVDEPAGVLGEEVMTAKKLLLHLHHLGKGLGCLADVGFAIGSAVVLEGCVCALQSSAGASWLPETILGQCLRPEKRVVVLLNREMKEPQAVEVLCHEWAHALAWNFSVGRLINAPDTDPVAFERGCHDEA